MVMVEVDVMVSPVGSWPILELCGLDDKIKFPLPSASVVIEPTEVPSIDTSSVVPPSAPVMRTRRICVDVPSAWVMVVNTALPAEVPEFVSGATNRDTLPCSPPQP